MVPGSRQLGQSAERGAGEEAVALGNYRSDRIMYGSDFPNIPYEWDRELNMLAAADIPDEALERITWKNAADFFNLSATDVNL